MIKEIDKPKQQIGCEADRAFLLTVWAVRISRERKFSRLRIAN